MTNFFESAAAESVGIASDWLTRFLMRLEAQDLPLHSAIIMRHDKICMETYYAPYTKDTLHRMFSITKSFVSLAIGLLEAEGKLSLDDKIVSHFPEKQPADGAYEYTKMMTIRDMLAMTSCHDKTTYKGAGVTDWVGSFFTTPPNHVPGTNFSYDTSSTHTLAALAEKLSGMPLLDYLRVKFLNEMDFSKDAFILPDPSGVSMGGSGLCATPCDILKVIYLIAHDGVYNGRQLLPREYVQAAKRKHSDTYGKQSALEEIQGYGYQIWMTRNGGYVLFGMGGQLALYVPEKDIFMVTTADAQGRQGGVQLIYDAFWEEIYQKITADALPEDADAAARLKDYADSRKLFVLPGETASPVCGLVNGITYRCDENGCGVTDVTLCFDETKDSGSLVYTNASGTHTLNFGIGSNRCGQFPDYDLKYAASGAWRTPQYFLIKVQIIDTAVGNMYIGLTFKDNYVTVMFRKIEETLFSEYNGVFSGKK